MIAALNNKIATLARRRDHLEHRLKHRSSTYTSTQSAEYDREESDALTTAIEVMEAHANRDPRSA